MFRSMSINEQAALNESAFTSPRLRGEVGMRARAARISG
jgi:hypothetical protein